MSMNNENLLERRFTIGWGSNSGYTLVPAGSNFLLNKNEDELHRILLFGPFETPLSNAWNFVEIDVATEDRYEYVTPPQFQNYVTEIYKREILGNGHKLHEIILRHDATFNKDVAELVSIIVNNAFISQVCDGRVSIFYFEGKTGHANYGYIEKIIAGANWLSGEVGKTIIAKAVANNRGTEEEVKAQLRNRIVMRDEPVAIDERNIDRWPPIITYNAVSTDEYYRRSPGFVLPQDRRPATDALLEFQILDETGLTVQTQYRNETATVEPTGSFWIESGNILTITATDTAGNLTVKHFANSNGTISEALTEIEE